MMDINNWDPMNPLTYGAAQNHTAFGLNFRGLGLPTKSFNKFKNLLSVITKGEADCWSIKSGYCALSRPCSEYSAWGVWDYSFKVNFVDHDGSSAYLRIPLATFATDSDSKGVCVLYVEYLDS